MIIHESRQTVFNLWISYTLFVFSSLFAIAMERNIQFAKETRLETSGIPEVFETIAHVGLHSCVELCKRRPACNFINYRRTVPLCTLIRHGNQNQTVTINERRIYVTGSKSDWNMTSYVGCVNCSIGDTCSEIGHEISCRVTSCGPPTMPEGVAVNGNIYRPGSRLILRCVDGFESEQGGQERITCLTTGLWTTTNFSCVPPSTTPTILPTTTPPFSCHSFDDNYRTVGISDNSVVTYKINTTLAEPKEQAIQVYRNDGLYATLAVPNEQASQVCRNDGGELVKINTTARMDFVRQLTSCPAMPADDVWVDGKYNIHTNTWLFTDGDAMPMTTDFWRPGAPDNLDTEHCVRLVEIAGFPLNNKQCSMAFLFLCEVF